MFSRCPDCQTLFRVRAETLRVAQGQVRCGRCGLQFNALDSLAEDPETLDLERNGVPTGVEAAQSGFEVSQATDRELQDVDAETARGATSAAVEGALASPETEGPAEDLAEADDAKQDIETEGENKLDTEPVSPQPETPREPVAGLTIGLTAGDIQAALLSEEPAATAWGLRIAGFAAVLLLLTALAVQWLYMQRVPLYAQPQFRPVLQRLCGLLSCELPLPRKPEQIEVLERVVREHPRVPKALLVDLTFVSRAGEPIAYPWVELRLADVSGNRVAGRQFAPSDYLSAHARHPAGLAPNQPLHITLELVAPATDVVSFQFDFL